MGKFDGKVAFVTGAARGQGRSHAVRLAEEGADIIAVDLCRPIDSVPYALSTPDDLARTVKEVEALDRRIIATEADVRDGAALRAAVDAGVAELGRLDIVLANAGIFGIAPADDLDDDTWRHMVDTNLTGVWFTVKAALPHLGAGAAIVLTSSTAGLRPFPGFAHYVAAKHGVVGLAKTLALELAPRGIRVNSLHPTTVNTPMVQNDALYALFSPDQPDRAGFTAVSTGMHALPIPWIEPADVTNAVVWLCSDEARYVTGTTLSVDAGFVIK